MSLAGLSREQIDAALPAVARGLTKYLWLQANLRRCDVSQDKEYQRRFNGFYRVRRSTAWQGTFYQLLEAGKTSLPSLATVLTVLHQRTGRVEASFGSKLLATLDPTLPVIDSVVLGNLGLKLPVSGPVPERVQSIIALHDRMRRLYAEWLDTPQGRYLIAHFTNRYPRAAVSPVKMLDLVLWQTRNAA
jgi:hypothetical protein